MRRSGRNVWRSLRMRGGFRRQWWRGLQLLLVTDVANALRRSEEIALAAEVKTFSPDRSRSLSIKIGAFDFYIIIFADYMPSGGKANTFSGFILMTTRSSLPFISIGATLP